MVTTKLPNTNPVYNQVKYKTKQTGELGITSMGPLVLQWPSFGIGISNEMMG